jgi:hypothetical protein
MNRTPTERSFRAGRRFTAGLLVALLGAPALRAEPGGDRASARAHFERGVASAKHHAFTEALSEFQLAYAAFPNHAVLYNIAQALILLNRPSEAVRTLERYLFEGGAQIDPERRSEVEASILRERARTASLTILVEPAGAKVTLDTTPLGTAPFAEPIRVDPGAHRVRAELESGVAREVGLELAPEQTLVVRLELVTRATPPPEPALVSRAPTPAATLPKTPPPAPAPLAPRANGARDRRLLGYVVGAAGVALTGAALGHYLWNRARYEDWRARRNEYYRDPTDERRAAVNDLGRSIPAASAVTVGLTIGAGVALGTGTVLLFTSAEPRARAGQLCWQGRF